MVAEILTLSLINDFVPTTYKIKRGDYYGKVL